ncbi:MAG TPA: ABC transporter permease, partial [Vicinamibacterales bacterium]|nr:ABC transporter permease [Vicinamibacterales bacterium]
TGTNIIQVSAGNVSQGGVRQGQGNASTLTPDDAKAIGQVQGVQYVAAGLNTRAQMIVGDQNWNTYAQGTDVDFPLIRSWDLEDGSFFTTSDVRSAEDVVVLGSSVRDELYGPDVDPTGDVLRIQSRPFTVVGVMTSKGQTSFGQDQDDVVFIPYTTVMKKMRGVTFVQQITVSAASADATDAVADRIATLMRVRHKIAPGESDDFFVRTNEEIAAARTRTLGIMTSLLAGIAAVSLLVGGIGIMNIMLVSVTERTREIGLRLAIGAHASDVLLQFLVESVALSLFGGAIGIALGIGLAKGISLVQGWPTAVSPDSAALAAGFAALVGVFFGYYPAHKAAALDPIDALRYE